ncbi:LysM peptidoglycan-binding domain-containing protein [Nocardia puris]|uniref:D-mannose binding lectin n=1 Tax=Nocardia puris TaxID=208602 RepID=A0A366D3P5_9NOCA|nr:LysM peptidoglycan-binding domain-containing protein [Nocardia puris]MBF6214829.1 LysM peptidoglycan-binding domain-containing protein [Nocardia puris]MBF6364162.1 LysM peptidoglycan-binding domain-containing protein [Nocardia puris]MBF6459091.1 LysM peptidoglycan-binding domain-containing protein [Nocardia puris]RBO84555.1 D-mannose binding lectin [Nocardia puris]
MGDTLRVGEELGLGQSLTGGAYTLTLQPDGNLVLSEPDGTVVWATQTHDQGVERAALQSDGNFVLYKGEGAAWSTETNGKSVDRLVVQADRNVVLYGTDGSAAWSSGTHTDNPLPAPEPVAAAPVAEEVPPPPPPAPEVRTYTVEPGDTLWAIAERFYGDGNRYQEIANASGIANPDLINPGQVLTIP